MTKEDLFDDFEEFDNDNEYQDLSNAEQHSTKSKLSKRRRIEEIIEQQRLEEELSEFDYYLKHRNREHANKRARKR